MPTLAEVNSTVRPVFEETVTYINDYLTGFGIDMGCGSCPLVRPNCVVVNEVSDPTGKEQVPQGCFNVADARHFNPGYKVDYIFSSHMLEDLGGRNEIINCLKNWSELLYQGGHIVLLLPDMQGGRYPTVEEGGNISHKVNVGRPFFEDIINEFDNLEIVQMDTIPHDKFCTIDIVLRKYK